MVGGVCLGLTDRTALLRCEVNKVLVGGDFN